MYEEFGSVGYQGEECDIKEFLIDGEVFEYDINCVYQNFGDNGVQYGGVQKNDSIFDLVLVWCIVVILVVFMSCCVFNSCIIIVFVSDCCCLMIIMGRLLGWCGVVCMWCV